MANKTPNYGLTKPLPEEFYDVGVHNQNMDKIDTELKKKYDANNKPTAADVGAAPAGFGLGTIAVEAPTSDISEGDANAIRGTGFYKVIKHTAFDGYGWSYLVHIQTSETSWIQFGWHPTRPDLGYKMRRATSSGIGEWEPFVNAVGGVPTTGGEMTGNLTFMGSGLNNPGVVCVTERADPNGGYWAHEQLTLRSKHTGKDLYRIACFGDKENLRYMYIGSDSYDGANNLRIYTDGQVKIKGMDALHTGNSNMTRLVSTDTTPTVNNEINWTYK